MPLDATPLCGIASIIPILYHSALYDMLAEACYIVRKLQTYSWPLLVDNFPGASPSDKSRARTATACEALLPQIQNPR